MTTIKRICSILEEACGVGDETLAEFVAEIATKNGSSVGKFSTSLAEVGAEFPEDVVARIWQVVQSAAADASKNAMVTKASAKPSVPTSKTAEVPSDAGGGTVDPKDALMQDFLANELGESHATSAAASADGEASRLPSDFFDKDPKAKKLAAGSNTGSKKRKDGVAESIPEGFFDDPVRDAKIRKVPVKNEAEEEWQRFEKDMATETKISEDLLETDFNQMSAHRIVDDERDQKRYEAKAQTLKLRGQELLKKRAAMEAAPVSEGGGEDAELGDGATDNAYGTDSDSDDDELGWRSKGI